MSRKISEERKAAYYIGMILMILGGILFISVFFTQPDIHNFSRFESQANSMNTRAVAGIILLIIGGIIRGIGARGLAGSGVILDPQKARRELEPYSRMAGGMVKDALKETDFNLAGKPEKIVMIRCRACGKLNEEDSKFCQECGKPL